MKRILVIISCLAISVCEAYPERSIELAPVLEGVFIDKYPVGPLYGGKLNANFPLSCAPENSIQTQISVTTVERAGVHLDSWLGFRHYYPSCMFVETGLGADVYGVVISPIFHTYYGYVGVGKRIEMSSDYSLELGCRVGGGWNRYVFTNSPNGAAAVGEVYGKLQKEITPRLGIGLECRTKAQYITRGTFVSNVAGALNLNYKF